MSASATIILRAACDSVKHLDGQSVTYNAAENVRARDLVNFVTDSYALHGAYMFQIKCKSSDINGKPKITTLVPMSPVTNGETYYFIISRFCFVCSLTTGIFRHPG
jgi:hypothetical protein